MILTKRRIVLSIAVLFLAVGIGVFSINAVQAEVSEQTQVNNLLANYFDALKNSDVEGIMKYCIDARGNKNETKDLYTEMLQKNKYIPESIEAKNLHEIKAGLYNVDLYVQYKDGQTQEVKDFKIVKVKDEWKAYITPDPYKYNLEEDLKMIENTENSHTT